MPKPKARGVRLKPYTPIRPLSPNAKLAPYSVPAIPSGKFKDIPGQLALTDEDEDESVGEPE